MRHDRRLRARSADAPRYHERWAPRRMSFVTVSAQSSSIHNLVQPAIFARCSMPNLTLYHASPSRSSVVLWMLEELGEPYDIKLLRLSAGENMKPDYLAINPMGKVPALKHGDTVITELAAICAYL